MATFRDGPERRAERGRGPQGQPGARGSGILSAIYGPQTNIGQPGDFWLDRSTWRLYGPKPDEGAWPEEYITLNPEPALTEFGTRITSLEDAAVTYLTIDAEVQLWLERSTAYSRNLLLAENVDQLLSSITLAAIAQDYLGADKLRSSRKFWKGLAHAEAGTLGSHRTLQQARIACVGTSITQGYGASVDQFTNAHLCNWPAHLANRFNAAGRPTQIDSLWGNGGVSKNAMDAYDNRLGALDALAWTVATHKSLGGYGFTNISTTEPLVWTPSCPWSYLEIYYQTSPGNGQFTISSNAGLLATKDGDAADGFVRTNIAAFAAPTYSPVTITPLNDGPVTIFGIHPWAFQAPGVSVMNMGWQGAKASDHADATNPWSALNALPIVVPDLTIIELGANDWANASGVTSLTFKAQVESILLAALSTGDALLMPSPPTNTATVTEDRQASFRAVMQELAEEYSVPYLDLNARWGGYAGADATNYIDNVHPKGVLHADMAKAVYNILEAV